MPAKPTKLQRWLDLIAYLAGRRFPVRVDEIWEHVPAYQPGLEGDETQKQTVRRMFERDKDELRELGIPIETVKFTIDPSDPEKGYRLGQDDYRLPYLKLVAEARAGRQAHTASKKEFEVTEQEAGAALLGLQELAAVPSLVLAPHARSAFRKLAFDLDPGVLRDAPVLYAEDPEATATKEVLHELSDAVRRRKRVRFRYHAMTSDMVEEREVNPYGLLFQHGRWYLVAHDVGRDAVRMFRVGRIDELRPNTKKPGTADFEVPADFELSAFSGRKAWELGADPEPPATALVYFRFPRSLWAERNEHGELVREEADGAQLRRFEVRRRDPFLRWLLSLAGDAWVEEPVELREAFRAMAAEVLRRHSRKPSRG
ncbi:MAG TPA: WYL domain-containing protein [Longimicrobiales bacterium]|nr:WYL domain-containing protein [Longimicrobiales bacterium]